MCHICCAADKKPGSGAPPFVSVEEDEEYPKLKLDKVSASGRTHINTHT